jgi:hypothetical protein
MPIARDIDITRGTLRGVTGRLERVPLSGAATTSAVAGTSSTAVGSSSSGNKDGSSNRAVLTTTAAIPSMAVVRDNVYGRVVGVRFLKQQLATTAPFDMVIDGVAYPVDVVASMRDNQTLTGADIDALVVVAENLQDKLHTVEVHLAGSATQARRLEVFGWIGESGRGYNSPPPARFGSTLTAGVAITTSATGISYVNLVAGMTFYNSTAADRTVTLAIGGNPYQVITVPANKSITINFPTPRQLSSWTWMADAAGVTAWTENI